MLHRAGPVWVSSDLGGLHGLDLGPVFHPGEMQVGGIEIAHLESEVLSPMRIEMNPRGLSGNLQGGNSWIEEHKETSAEISPVHLSLISLSQEPAAESLSLSSFI